MGMEEMEGLWRLKLDLRLGLAVAHPLLSFFFFLLVRDMCCIITRLQLTKRHEYAHTLVYSCLSCCVTSYMSCSAWGAEMSKMKAPIRF